MVCDTLFMRLQLRRRMKTCLVAVVAALAESKKKLQIPPFPLWHPMASRGGQSEQAFLDQDGMTNV